MTRRLAAIADFLELDGDELRALAQWAALALVIAFGLIFAAFILGTAAHVFRCAGGWAC